MRQVNADSSIRLAVIGGSGLYSLRQQDGLHEQSIVAGTTVQTPYASSPVMVCQEETPAGPVWFIPRHGRDHSIAPHLINYRANLWALQAVGATAIIGVNAVGGITELMTPGTLVLPDQIVDYTWGREHTYFSEGHTLERHVDFTWPYDAALNAVLLQTAAKLELPLSSGAVYACTQGPRLETAAEVRKLRQDGCDIVGMTGMPEAALARELGLRYACIALVVNKAAGLGTGLITVAEMEGMLAGGIHKIRELLLAAIPRLLEAQAQKR